MRSQVGPHAVLWPVSGNLYVTNMFLFFAGFLSCRVRKAAHVPARAQSDSASAERGAAGAMAALIQF
jgi:hypothetical protein